MMKISSATAIQELLEAAYKRQSERAEILAEGINRLYGQMVVDYLLDSPSEPRGHVVFDVDAIIFPKSKVNPTRREWGRLPGESRS